MEKKVSCQCGSLQYALAGEPLHQLYCHCTDCQAVHGGAYAAIATFPHDAVTHVSGEMLTWTLKSTPRTYCPKCCTLMFAEPEGAPFKGVEAHLISGHSFNPTYHMQCAEASLPIQDGLPHYAGFAPALGGGDETVDW